jgi:hypothetical protein
MLMEEGYPVFGEFTGLASVYKYNLRYVNGIFGSEEFATFPEAVEGCDDGAWNDAVENL